MLNRFITLVIASLTYLLVFSANVSIANAADAERGEKLSQTCLGCHGAPGLRNPGPVYSIPMVGGQHAEYIVTALKAYKSQERSHKTMQAQASNLSDQDMADIAAYFASIKGESRPAHVSSAKKARGKEKAAQCATCHGSIGDGDQPGFPKLAGQYQSYLAQALKDYRSGERDNAIMKGFAAGLSFKDIDDLSAYFGSQKGGLSGTKSRIKASYFSKSED